MAATFLVFVAMTTAVVVGQEGAQPPRVAATEPELVIKPASETAAFDFVCRATGLPKPVITWYHDGIKIIGGPNMVTDEEGTLSFKRMEQGYKGKYQCKAENEFGLSMSNVTTLDFAFLNDFAAIPEVVPPTPIEVGQPLQLKCEYADPFSNPRPTWTWVRQSSLSAADADRTVLDYDGRLTVDPSGTLYFQHVLSTDGPSDSYHLCEAYNRITGTKKIGSPYRIEINNKEAAIEAREPRLVYDNGPKIEVVEGEDIELYCIFEGYPLVLVKWEKLGDAPKPDMENENGKSKLVMKMSESNNKFEGQYRCQGYREGEDDIPAASVTFDVSVLQKPRFLSGPVDTNVTVGGSIEITCEAEADPPAKISWFVNGLAEESLEPDNRRTIQDNTFKLTDLRGIANEKSDLQVVACMAENKKDGTEIGRSYMEGHINVVSAMSFVIKPKDYEITASTKEVVLDCEVSSGPNTTPQISWQYNKTAVTQVVFKLVRADNNSLIIHPQAFENLDKVVGEYTCVANTPKPLDRIAAVAFLTRSDQPRLRSAVQLLVGSLIIVIALKLVR